MGDKFNSSVIELSQQALISNLGFIRERIGENVVFSSVVKGNAYGHGIEVFVPMALKCGVRHFSVYSVDEALRVFNIVGTGKATIMIMGMIETEEALEWAISNEIEYFVFDMARLELSEKIARKSNKKAIVHIELETGMNRTGFDEGQLPDVVAFLKKNEFIRFKGLCTHFAGAENISNFVRVKNQIKNYHKICRWFEDKGLKPEIKHTSCSAAVIRYPEMNLDMVRVGILQYGLWPSVETFIDYSKNIGDKKDPLFRLITWKSKIMSTKFVKTGEFIGYGTSFLAQEDMKVAIIPVGYAHGYSRSLSNYGRVLVRGKQARIVGIVNMNVIITDITNFPEVEKGDEVILIGNSGNQSVSIASFSEMTNQLNYEMLTRLPLSIPRKVIS